MICIAYSIGLMVLLGFLAYARVKALAEKRRSRLSPPAGLPGRNARLVVLNLLGRILSPSPAGLSGRSARLDRRRAFVPSVPFVPSVSSASSAMRHQLRRIVHV